MSPTDARTLSRRLSDRDQAVLDDVETFRLLSTRQVQRLHFPIGADGHLTKGAATKSAMRVLRRLKGLNLLDHLERRIGGQRRGSEGYIWQLAAAGDHLQRSRRGETGRRRYVEPSALFADHTLMVAEIGVTIRELETAGRLDVLAMHTEPACWRDFTGPHGVPQTLKPDLYSRTATRDFEDHLFIEADRGSYHRSEHLPVIAAKCRTYAAYHASGIEQHERGVFPAVLWVTETTDRADAITRTIEADPLLPDGLFQVVTLSELPTYLTAAADTS